MLVYVLKITEEHKEKFSSGIYGVFLNYERAEQVANELWKPLEDGYRVIWCIEPHVLDDIVKQ